MRNSVNSRSRKKLNPNNYNSFYNRNLKKTDFIRRHPDARTVSAFLAETTPSATRGAISSPFTTTPFNPGLEAQRYYVIEEISPIGLEPQAFEEVINEAEDGELLAIECVTNSPLITIEVVVYGLGNSPNIINNYSINEMIRRGRGLTPGEVETLPGGRSKDQTGTPRRYYPYVARYKDEELADYLGDERRWFVFVYEPAVPMPYSSLIINVKNTSTELGKTVDSINVHRRVYGTPLDGTIAGQPIDSFDVFKKEQEEAAAAATPPVPVVVPAVSTTASPLITNYYENEAAAAAAANAPEVIASEEDEFIV